MIPQELTDGVKKMLEAGAPREVVRGFLFERGWTSEDADEVFATIDREIEAQRERERVKQEEARRQEKQEEIRRQEEVRVREEVRRRNELRTEEALRVQKEQQKKLGAEVGSGEESGSREAATTRPLSPQVRHSGLTATPRSETERSVVRISGDRIIPSRITPNTETSQARTVKVNPPTPKREPPASAHTPKVETVERVKKERPLPRITEALEDTERFEMDSISSPLVLVSSALSLVKTRFWNLFFLSFMVSVVYLLIYVVLYYAVDVERLRDLFERLVTQSEGNLLLMALVVLTLLSLGFVAISLVLWLPASYVLALSGRRVTFRELFVFGFKGGFSLCISILFLFLFTLSGGFFFIIPGFLFAVWFIFAPVIAVVEKTTPFQALLVSRELVRSHFMQVISRELFLLIPTALFAFPLLLLVSPLGLLDSFGVGLGLIVLLFISFALLLLVFAYLLFFFAYHVAFYKEMRARAHSVTLSSRFAKLLPLFLVIPLIISLALAFYATSQLYV